VFLILCRYEEFVSLFGVIFVKKNIYNIFSVLRTEFGNLRDFESVFRGTEHS
jgi:hypothetical protein